MKPHYRYDREKDTYIGGTKYINSWVYWPVTLFGVFIALSRLRDPLLRAKLRNIWYTLTCRAYKRMEFEKFDALVKKNQLHSFLRQSLNTELVLIILKGITVLAASTSDNVDHMSIEDAYRIKQTTTIELTEVKIAHAREFFIDKQGEQLVQVSQKRERVSSKNGEEEFDPTV